MLDLQAAVAALRRGGVVAYPTESVYGLGCDPADAAAMQRLLQLKQRPPQHGVLLIAAAFDQVQGYIDLARVPPSTLEQVMAHWPGPHTWIFPAAASVPAWIAGRHEGIALRVTAHPIAAALCTAFGGALVSTSANRHGEPPTKTAAEVRSVFADALDAVVEGPTGGLERPTAIRDAISGEFVRR